MTFTVRPCANLDEFGRAVLGVGQYFGMELDEERMERFSRNLPLGRMHAAFEGSRIVGGAGAFPFEMTLPGGTVRTAGVTVVGTYPTHRRRGVLRALMRAQLDDVRERGESVAALWASEDTIYGRFGYGMASFVGDASIPAEYSEFTHALPRPGSLRLVEQDEALAVFPRIWDRVRRRTPGMLSRSRTWWELRVLAERLVGGHGGPKRFVLLEDQRRPVGYAVYRHKPAWEEGIAQNELEIVEAVALDGLPTAQIWRFLLDIDWSARYTARLPLDHPLLWLLAHPRRMRFRVLDGLWVRLVDVGAALTARRYATDSSLVLEVQDAFCPWNEGRWRIADGAATRTRAAPQIRCDVAALGSVYLGGVSFSQLVRGGRVEELRRGAAVRADAMFAAGRHPWCPEIF
ncbi:MAG TPA: GNAT family N-acetyltransferase [Gaiellaceae bacterium]|nr:GNAT family N-acetyltransferase [Gaiellaceae bacterium]